MSNPATAMDDYFDGVNEGDIEGQSPEMRRPSRKPLLDSTIESIRDALLNGLLPPGGRLDEYAISEELSVSRATVREAIRQLEQQGLLVRIPFKGTFARELSREELEEITALRGVLEGFAAEQIILRGSKEDVKALEAAVDRMVELPPEAEFEEALKTHLAFHRTLCQLSGNTFLYEAWSNLTLHVLRILRLSQRFYAEHERERTLAKAHKQIVDAIAKGDVEMAREAIRAHITTPGFAQLMEEGDSG